MKPSVLFSAIVVVQSLCAVGIIAAEPSQITTAAMSLLEQSCVECHCPEKDRGGLDLTTRAALLEGGDSGPVIDAGKKAEASPLYRSTAHLDDPFMPHKRDKLPEASIKLLAKWIDAGAPYDRVLIPPRRARADTLWSFQPLKKPALPKVSDESWARTPIDRFVIAAQQRVGLTPNAGADKRTLVRRLYFDLVGLPPAPSEIDAFVIDPDPNAYEKLVDRLLASPRYGERWARHWLDLARYADSMGYRFDDNTPGAYQYRDFVIRAFNSDLPFNTFVQWQFAGDELAPANREAVAATGFLAVGPRERDEGDPLNRRVIRNNELDDILTTSCATMLGLTMGCARCHDHKFDPLSQREYYQMMTAFVPGQRKELPLESPEAAEQRKTWEAANTALELRAAEWSRHNAGLIEPVVEAWKIETAALEAEFMRKAGLKVLPQDLTNVEFRLYGNDGLEALPDFDKLTPRSIGVLRPARIDPTPAPKGTRAGLVLTGLLSVPAGGSYNFHLTSDDRARVILNGKTIVETDGLNGLSTRSEAATLAKGQAQIRVEYLQGNYGTELKLAWDGPGVPNRSLSDAKTQLAFLQQLKQKGAQVLGAELYRRYQSIDADLARFQDDPLACAELRASLPASAVAEAEAIGNERKTLVRAAPPSPARCLAYVDKSAEPVKSYLLQRGSVESPGEEVHLGFIAGLSAPDYQSPAKPPGVRGTFYRGTLAHWITDADKGAGRLLARVMVNRLWYYHFGEGLVRTPNDFGSQGDAPAMPELLDWMAAQFIEGGWRIKSLQKLIVMSAAYRQDTAADPAKLAIDPENRFWSRRRPLRIEAEVLRDSILAVSGRLNDTMYGPAVMVPIPAEVIITRTDGKGNYPKDVKEGPEVWRRSVYVFQKRTVPVPLTAVFDGPDNSCSLGRREKTTVAPQALFLMNDAFVRSCSAQLANDIQTSVGTDQPADIDAAFRKMLGRAPRAGEARAAAQFLERQMELRKGDRTAALADFCQALLSLNEFMYID